MKGQSAGTGVGFGLVLVISFGVSTTVAAQVQTTAASDGGARWGVVDAIGYGGLGFGLGLMASWDMEGSGFGPPGAAVAAVGVTTVLGTVAGAVIGTRAQRAIAAPGELDGAHRVAVIAGGLMAGGTLGSLVAVPLINGEGEGTFLGSDERTVVLLALAGTALGSVYVWTHRAEFSSSGVNLTPEISGRGEYGIRLRVAF
jgi:hypothetical protein